MAQTVRIPTVRQLYFWEMTVVNIAGTTNVSAGVKTVKYDKAYSNIATAISGAAQFIRKQKIYTEPDFQHVISVYNYNITTGLKLTAPPVAVEIIKNTLSAGIIPIWKLRAGAQFNVINQLAPYQIGKVDSSANIILTHNTKKYLITRNGESYALLWTDADLQRN